MENCLTRLNLDDKEIILIGTFHISHKSVEDVKKLIESEKPDTICVELDEHRYNAMINKDQWQEMDIFRVIKEKKSLFLFINLALWTMQKNFAKEFDIEPGAEMLQAIESANKVNADLVLADRCLQTTFLRIWHNVGIYSKVKLIGHILYVFFNKKKISKNYLEALTTKTSVDNFLKEFTEKFSELKIPLIDERDQFLAQKIKEAPGKKIVAVLGAAHIPGITKEINNDYDLNDLCYILEKSKSAKLFLWSLPILLIAMIGVSFSFNPHIGINSTFSWIFWNSTLGALGALIALGHPISIFTAALISPITSLLPILGAGWIVGLVEASIRKPKVRDLEAISNDIFSIKEFWCNGFTRILLIIALTGFGSTLGGIIGGADVIRMFLQIFKRS
ncbi:MAG: TraB/GumN family protein [Clostridiales bacterium]|nr:TraB/GumN family protein [Clostridiales bacterium]